MAIDLTIHMKQAEFILFPYIRKMVRHGRKVQSRVFKSVHCAIALMVRDHASEGRQLGKLVAMTHHYTVSDNTCTTFKMTYYAMGELHDNLLHHLDVENNVLFRKAKRLEERFNNKN